MLDPDRDGGPDLIPCIFKLRRVWPRLCRRRVRAKFDSSLIHERVPVTTTTSLSQASMADTRLNTSIFSSRVKRIYDSWTVCDTFKDLPCTIPIHGALLSELP